MVNVDKDRGSKISIISKIENHQGVQNFDAILRVTDGIMVARGDLGVEVPSEKVFLAQKMMCAKCNMMSKPIIVATQMLESMTLNPRPTRAEATDVANAVLDGADCVMLSGETAKGKYPLETVSMMDKICREAESALNRYQYFNEIRQSIPTPLPTDEVICCSAILCCYEQHANAIIVLTNQGSTARLLSKYRPPCPIIAVLGQTTSEMIARQCEILSGVFAMIYDDSKGKKDADDRIRLGINYGKEMKFLNKDDHIVCVHADTMGKGFANMLRILTVTD
jgi:pyruvate kinase